MPCGTLRYSTKGVIKGWDYTVTLGIKTHTNKNIIIKITLGRMDYVQFARGSPKIKNVSPDRLKQPINMRLFQVQAKRMLKDTG